MEAIVSLLVRRYAACLIVAAAGLCLAAPAAASASARVRVLPLDGDLSGLTDGEAKALREALEAEVQARPTRELAPRPKGDFIDLMFDAECVEPNAECLAGIGSGAGATHVLFYEASGKAGAVTLELRWVKVANKRLEGERSVKAESIAAAVQAAGPALDAWLGVKPPPKPKRVTLRVRSNPAAAVVTLQGEEVGVTPAEVRRDAGRYTLRVSKAGYEDVVREIELRDKDVDLSMELTARPDAAAAAVATTPADDADADDEGAAYYQTWWFWTLVGVGAAGAGVGIAAATGAFDKDATSTGGLGFQLGARPDRDVLIQGQFR